MRKFLLGLVTLFLVPPAFSQLPDFYRQVDRVSWVVEDLDRVTREWGKLGFSPAKDYGEVDLSNVQFRGRPTDGKIRLATLQLGALQVNWIQPLSGENAYSEFLTKHGSGIFSLVHQTPTLQAFKSELERLRGLGVAVLQSGSVQSDNGPINYAYLDTKTEGKYNLGLIHLPGTFESNLAAASQTPRNLKLSQFAFVIRDPQPVSAFWKKLGFPGLSITHGPLRDRRYRGAPGQFDHNLGWQRHGNVVYEWCIPLKGPTVYEEHLKNHGEGVHHLGFNVQDIDKEIAEWSALGFPVSQSGAWGEAGKPGSGRFAYMDTDKIGGVTVELLWSFD